MTAAERHALTALRAAYGDQPFRIADALTHDVSRSVVYRLRAAGHLTPVGRGVLQLPDGGDGMLSDLAIVSTRVPRGTICLNSALSYWDLTDEIPESVHLAVPRGTHRPTIATPRTRVHVFDPRTFDVDRRQARTDVDESFWIYSPERSVVDALRLEHIIGRDVGLHALRGYVRRAGAEPARLTALARVLGGSRRLAGALEALLS